jgi:PBSX family phage portal protein
VNIDGFGHQLVAIDPARRDEPEVKEEWARLTNFFTYAYFDGSFVDLRRKIRRDLEFTGNAFIEVIRSPSTDKIDGFEHLPARDMWIGKISKEGFEVKQKKLIVKPDGTHELDEERVQRRFRTYFQSRDAGVTGVWFREFNDPRPIRISDGDPARNQSEEEPTNEVIHLRHYCARSPYGLPRYVSQVLTIFGDRAAEEINYTTLKQNNIPAMLILVANGMLTEGTIKRLEEFSTQHRAGKKDYSRIVVIEAEGDAEGDTTNVKVEAKSLVDTQQRDELFKEYTKSNSRKLRQIFRLPPIIIGEGEDYSRATAVVARKLAEEQVFAPEREEFDRFINRIIMPELGAKFHLFKSHSPNVTNDEDLIQVLQVAEKTGAMTPRIARQIVEEILNRVLGSFPKDGPFSPDVPFTLTMAEKVKNQAAMSVPTQVTPDVVEAIKAITGGPAAEVVEGLMELRKYFETTLLGRSDATS